MRQLRSLSRFPQLNPQVWILAGGRFLSDIGSGFTLFYAPIFFVNQVGLSATEVGLALGIASVSGVAGRILSGTLADSPRWGRRRTLLLATAVLAIAALVLATTHNLTTLIVGNLLSGLGIGLYWPATESIVADLTQGEQRREAYAITRLADNLGLGVGIVLGGLLISATNAYRTLFLVDALSFVVFFGVVYFAIAKTYPSASRRDEVRGSAWFEALGDRRLQVYIVANIIFTTYIAQLHSTIPLYFSNFIGGDSVSKGFAAPTISGLFAWHLALNIISQMPAAYLLKRFSHVQTLTISAILWSAGFGCMWLAGVVPHSQLFWAIFGLGVLAIATVCYSPAASSLVADIAPPSLRAIYISINSLCWAAGYFIGPTLGGWVLDQSRMMVVSYWVALSISVVGTAIILQYLDRTIRRQPIN